MTVKELIQKVRTETVIVRHKEEELYRLETLCGVSGIRYGGEKGSGSRNINKNEQSYLNYIEFKDELSEYIQETLENRKRMMALIDTLKNRQAVNIMYKYCMENYTIRQIADELNYSRQSVHRIYLNAIEEMEKSIQKEAKGDVKLQSIVV